MSSNASGSSSHDSIDVFTSQTQRRTRSNVWEHFEPNLVKVNGELKAICKYCGIHLNTKSGTTSLRGHIANACPAIPNPIRQKFQATLSKQPSSELPFVFDPQLCRKEMIKYIIHAEIPFLKFEDPYLQPWLRTLQPTFKVRGRQTIRDDCLKKYVEMKKELQAELRSLDSRVCLASDIWTSSQDFGICEFLKAFEDLTLAVSADRKPTAHMFLPLVLCIQHALKVDPALQSTDLLKELASSMCSKFEKYWEPDEANPRSKDHNPLRKNKEIAFNLALVIATLLDPRKKKLYLDFFFKKVCKNVDQIGTRVEFTLVWMRKYFTLYEQKNTMTSCTNTSTSHSMSSSNIMGEALGKRKIDAEFAQYKSEVMLSQSQKSEIDVYLEEEPENNIEDFDVLSWWRSKAAKFPVLSAMARDFLAIPLSTVSSESAFSLGGRILGDHRSSLTPEMLDALVCAKDWLYKTKDSEFCSDGEGSEQE